MANIVCYLNLLLIALACTSQVDATYGNYRQGKLKYKFGCSTCLYIAIELISALNDS